MFLRSKYIFITLLIILIFRSSLFAATITIVPPVGIERAPEIVVVEWASAKKGEVLTRVNPPESVTLQAGDYGLRLVGTDYLYGPIRINKGTRLALELSSIRVSSPKEAENSFFFLIDKKTGAVAAKIRTNDIPVVSFPGEFKLKRDMAQVSTDIKLKTGDAIRISCGALLVSAPDDVGDVELFITDKDEKYVYSFFKYSQGAQALLPGTFKVIRRESGLFSREIVVEEGKTSLLKCGAVEAHSLAGKNIPFVIYTHPDLKPVLRGSSDSLPQLIFPGTYGLEATKRVKEYDESQRNERLLSSLAVTFSEGTTTSLWVTKDYTFFSSQQSEIPITVETLPGGTLNVDKECRIIVEVAEASRVKLFVKSPETEERLGEVASFNVKAPSGHVSVKFPDTLKDSTFYHILGEVKVQSGGEFTGISAPFKAVRSNAGTVKKPLAKATSPTTVEVKWKKARGKDIVGYNIYRANDRRPVNGKKPLSKLVFKDIGLSAGKKYSYVICAVDSRGFEGPGSEIVSVETEVVKKDNENEF